MNLPRHPLRVNAGFLLNVPIGTSRDIHFDYPQISLPPDLDLINFSGVMRLNRTPQGILVQAEFIASYHSECVRCLADILQPIHTTFSELYAFKHRSITDSGLILPEDANIDLEPLAREYLLIEIPISPLCRPDCKGLCPVCGENLNEGVCEHEQQVNS